MRRHGELLVKVVKSVRGKKLNHLILAEGEATGHKHEIVEGEATLYEHEGTFFLSCGNECKLAHPDQDTIVLPKGDYEITTQREYVVGDDKYRRVLD